MFCFFVFFLLLLLLFGKDLKIKERNIYQIKRQFVPFNLFLRKLEYYYRRKFSHLKFIELVKIVG